MEPIVNSKIIEFKLPAYKDGEFIDVSNKDIEGKWSVFFFYPAINLLNNNECRIGAIFPIYAI